MPKLHYLHEQVEGGKELFVYYCSRCRCILRVKRDLRPTSDTPDSFKDRCVSCGQTLADNMECRLAPVPADWSDAYQANYPPVKDDTGFRLASSLPHFSLGFPTLDSLLRPLSPGRTIVLSGMRASTVAELAAFRAQLPYELGGLDSTVLFVDGGNKSDPYLFSSFAKQWGVKPKAAMRRITTCRIFTMYQLTDMISNHLLPALQDYATKLVVISDLLGTFNEPELDDREARRLLCAIGQGIEQAKKRAIVLVTLGSPNKYDDNVSAWADTMVGLSDSAGRVNADLFKHPRMPPGRFNFKLTNLLTNAKMKATR